MNVLNSKFDPAYPLVKLRPHERNARQADSGAIHESITENGFWGALVVQASTGKILAGNHRYLVAKALGADTVPVIFVSVDDGKALKILLSDNRISDLGAYDEAALAELLDSVRIDHGLEGTGWDDDSYSNLLEDLKGIELGSLSGPPSKKSQNSANSDIVRPEVFDGPNPTVKTPVSNDTDPQAAPTAPGLSVLVSCWDQDQVTACMRLLLKEGFKARVLGSQQASN